MINTKDSICKIKSTVMVFSAGQVEMSTKEIINRI